MDKIMTRKQAAALRIERFLIKKACKKCQSQERYTSNGGCTGCHRARYYENVEEARRKTREWGQKNPDKKKEMYRKWYSDETNKERKLAYNKSLNSDRKDVVASQAKERYRQNKAKISAYMKERYKANRNQFLEYAANYRLSNPDRMKEYRKSNPDIGKVNHQNRRARKKQAEGHFTKEDIAAIRVMQRGKCAICRYRLESGNNGFHVDHIVSLAKGGTNWPRNLQLLCPSCNLEKHARDPIEHMQSLGFLL